MPFKSRAQQGMMFATHPKLAKKWAKETPNIKSLPKHVEESEELDEAYPGNGFKFYYVTTPAPGEAAKSLVGETTPERFAKAWGADHIDFDEIEDYYATREEALAAAEELVDSLQESMKRVEEKKGIATSRLEETIKKLQKEVNDHLDEATANPDAADQHHTKAEAKMAKIKELRQKCSMIEASKKPMKEKK